jgi:hypothetical protein
MTRFQVDLVGHRGDCWRLDAESIVCSGGKPSMPTWTTREMHEDERIHSAREDLLPGLIP